MSPHDDYDTPWKDAVTRYFPEFMAFYFPDAHAGIDWQQPYVFLEQELAQVARDGQSGSRRVDKLVQVSTVDARRDWLLVHVDVQAGFDREFALRMFMYNYRIFDRYRRPVASLALLADGRSRWRPGWFGYQQFGCEMAFRFPSVKLSDFSVRLDSLLDDANPFALVTAAHLLTQQTKGRDVQRHEAKWRLTRMLYERGWERQRIVDLYVIIAWMMRLPEALERKLWCDIADLERSNGMRYITPLERFGREHGLKEGRKEGRKEGQLELLRVQLEKRFGTLPETVVTQLSSASEEDMRRWATSILDAPSLHSLFNNR